MSDEENITADEEQNTTEIENTEISNKCKHDGLDGGDDGNPKKRSQKQRHGEQVVTPQEVVGHHGKDVRYFFLYKHYREDKIWEPQSL